MKYIKGDWDATEVTQKANKEVAPAYPVKAIDTPMRKVCHQCGREITHRLIA